MSDQDSSVSNFLNGLVLGAILGAGAYYFLTSTEEGKKVKKRLQEEGKDLLGDLTDLVEEVEEKGEEFKEKAQEVQKQLEEKTAKPALLQIEKLQDRGRRALKYFTRNGKPLS